LPALLNSIASQDFNDYEVIVADAGSEDRTIEIAETFGCKIAEGGFPPVGKNQGAKMARGDTLLFVDADVVLPQGFLRSIVEEFGRRELGVASFLQQSKSKKDDFLFKLLYNLPSRATERILPQAMSVILARKELHNALGGFDEEIKLAEELDYVRKGNKVSRFGVLKSSSFYASSRRYSRDGWFKTWGKYLLCQFHMILFGPVKTDIFKYRFNHYHSSGEEKEV